MTLHPLDASDTIAAVATPPGPGGVAVLRVSGPACRDIGGRLFRSLRPGFTGFKPHRLHYGEILDTSGLPLDRGLAVLMPGPGSFTGEDVLELHCHGGPGLVRAVLAALLASGARLARPGEFTQRAFLHGRLDLTQAEAVAEMVAAPSRAALAWAKAKLDGLLGRRVADLRRGLEELRVKLAVAVDFPEDEVDCCPPEELAQGADAARAGIEALLAGMRRAAPWREGAMVVLAGRVNAGKSSLLNALLGRERAIVADLPGTTRDYLEESLDLEGLPVRLVDTAGLRETGDVVELAGVRRGRELSDQADLVVLVAEATRLLGEEERALLSRLGSVRVLAALNKCDLAQGARPQERNPAADSPGSGGGDPSADMAVDTAGDLVRELDGLGVEYCLVSARTGLGLEGLGRAVRARLLADGSEPEPDAPVPNARQAEALSRAAGELSALAEEARAGLPCDLLGVRLELACAILSEITGEMAPDQVLDAIFSRFCIGK
jgi:tRNA modification GTPase